MMAEAEMVTSSKAASGRDLSSVGAPARARAVAPWPPKVRQLRKYRNIVIKAACNLHCTYCELKRAKVDVAKTNASIGKILSRFEPAEVFFRLEADGEITLYPGILDFLSECVIRDGYRIEVLSNGTRLPACLRPGLSWVLSLDGHTECMNRKRGLSQAQVDVILDHAINLSADVQCVFHGQSIEEMNDYIDRLSSRDFKGRLHIMPLLATHGRPLTVHLSYEKLHKAPFLECEEYFRRWDFIYENGRRGDFVCDQIVNGFNYYVEADNIEMVKCDCYTVPPGLTFRGLQKEREYDTFPCGTCLSHQEFNNRRSCMDI